MAKIEIDWDALVAVLAAILTKTHASTNTTPTVPPVGAPTSPQAPQPPPKPRDATGQVASLTVDLDLFLADGVPCPYRVDDLPDCYQIVKTDGTEALPIHGGAYLHAGYIGQDGKGIQFPPGSPLDHTAIWTARRLNADLQVTCGPGNPAKESGDRSVANFRLAEYERTRGMDVPIHFPPEANDTAVEVTLTVGTLTSKPVRFPRIS